MTEERFDRIEAHLDGDITFAELAAELNAAEGEELRIEVENARAARMAVFAAGAREDLAELHRRETTPAKVRRFPRWWTIAAAVLLLAMAVTWWLLPLDEANGRYADYLYDDPGLPVVMGTMDDPDFAEAMTRFKQEDYRLAAADFRALAEGQIANDTISYYYGISTLLAGEPAAAVTPLETVARDEMSLFREKAEWMLTLAYLEAERVAEAREVLTDIRDRPGHRFHERASELIGELGEQD
jgi:hypothetical protein